jgi:hypothetical protein
MTPMPTAISSAGSRSPLLAASQGALALLLKTDMKPAAAMMPAAFALIFHGEGRDAMEKAE